MRRCRALPPCATAPQASCASNSFLPSKLITRPDAADFTALVPYAQEVARNKVRLPATFAVWLASGVTSVIDVGGPFWNFAVRDAAMASESAPRVETTGPLISMVARPQLDLGDPPIIKVESAEAARALVARELPHHPDFIKMWFIHRQGEDLAAQQAIVAATAEAAHAAHLRLAVHATELETAKAAVRAGADYLVHSVFNEPIAPGKLADLVLLDADPLADVANLSHAVRVVKGGAVYDPKALIDRIR